MVSKLVLVVLMGVCVPQVKGDSTTRTVAFYDYCYPSGYRSYHVLVSKGETVKLTIDGRVIPYDKSCYIMLKASDAFAELGVKFTRFSLADLGTTLTLKSSLLPVSFDTYDVYNYINRPSIYRSEKTNRYLNISYASTSLFTRTLSASVDIYIKDDSDSVDVLGIGIIVAIAGSCIAVVVGVIAIIVCCVKNKSRGHRGTVMMAPTQTTTITTTNASTTTPYPYSVPPQQLAVHPGYMAPAPAYQTLFPNGTPGTAYPPQSSQVTGNPSSQGKVEPTAPNTDTSSL